MRVNAVAPGWIETSMTTRHITNSDGQIEDEDRAEFREQHAGIAPLGLGGEPDDPAHAVLYLVSDAARFVTGAVMRPNGG